MKKSELLNDIFAFLPEINEMHSPGNKVYEFLKKISRREIEYLFSDSSTKTVELEPYGKIIFPYFKMGNIDSLNLFDIDEIMLFAYYWCNRDCYKNILDVGANIGLHSIFLEKCGFNIQAYEPDPVHFAKLQDNLKINNCFNVTANNMAVSSEDGEMEFVRVLGNTTGSHLLGAKSNPYGELEQIVVKTKAFSSIIKGIDFLKLDIEGHEKDVILSSDINDWKNFDAMLSIHDKENARFIHDFFINSDINMFSQKIGWGLVRYASDIPENHYEGSLFVSPKKEMRWLNK